MAGIDVSQYIHHASHGITDLIVTKKILLCCHKDIYYGDSVLIIARYFQCMSTASRGFSNI